MGAAAAWGRHCWRGRWVWHSLSHLHLPFVVPPRRWPRHSAIFSEVIQRDCSARRAGLLPAAGYFLFCRCWSQVQLLRAGGCLATVAVLASHTCHQHWALSSLWAKRQPPSQPCLTSVAVVAAASGPYCSLKAKKDVDCRGPPPLSGLWPSNNVSPVPSKASTHSTPLLHYLPMAAASWGSCRCLVIKLGLWSCPFAPGNINTALSLCKYVNSNPCCNPICFSHWDSCTSQLLLIPVPTAACFSDCCTHRGWAALLPMPLTLRSHWAAPACSEIPASMHWRTLSTWWKDPGVCWLCMAPVCCWRQRPRQVANSSVMVMLYGLLRKFSKGVEEQGPVIWSSVHCNAGWVGECDLHLVCSSFSP